MQTSSSSRLARAPLLIPFVYFFVTRARSAKELAYHAASSFIPAWWLLLRLSGSDPLTAAVQFAAGYLCFIALYEIGYLANDGWDARRDPSSRRRLTFKPSPAFCTAFVALRLIIWSVVSVTMGWIANPYWLAACAALVIVFAEHNLLRSSTSRAASFYQLSVLRFALPVIAPLKGNAVAILLIAAMLFYSYFRFLSYLDSKDLLQMPDRRRRRFALVQAVTMLPLVALAAFACRAPVLAEVGVYFIALYLVWSLAAAADRHDEPRPSGER